MRTLWRLFSVLVMLLCVLGPSGARQARPAERSSSLEFENNWNQLGTDGSDDAELLKTMAGRVPELTAGEIAGHVGNIKQLFHRSLRKDLEAQKRLFPDNAVRRQGLLNLLKRMKSGIDADDVRRMLPQPGKGDQWDFEAVQCASFAEFSKTLWNGQCTSDLLTLLSQGHMTARPGRFLALTWLGYETCDPASRGQFSAKLDAACLKRPQGLSESEIRGWLKPLLHVRWNGSTTASLRGEIVRGLSAHLYTLTQQKRLAEGKNQLSGDQFVYLASHRQPWTDWTEGLARCLKDVRTRNDRVRELLARCVDQEGGHFGVLEKLVLVDDDTDFFVYLHDSARESAAGPWDTLNRNSRNSERSIRLVKYLFAVERRAKWSVPLLDLLIGKYYDRAPDGPNGLFESVVRPIVRSKQVLGNHTVRRELLTHILRGSFPPGGRRWTLAWDAAGEKRLLDSVELSQDTTTAIAFLGGVCRTLPLPEQSSANALKQVNETYGRLLSHVHQRLFQLRSPDCQIDHPVVVAELTQLFKTIAALRKQFRWRAEDLSSVRGFWNQVEQSFAAAAKLKDRPKMTAMLRLMLRICAVLGNPQPLHGLAKNACGKVFDVEPSTPFHAPPEQELGRQVELFADVAPAICDAVNAVKAEAGSAQRYPPEFVDEIVRLFQTNLYYPLLRTNEFLARAPAGKDDPWLRLAESYSSEQRRRAAWIELLTELGNARFLNSSERVMEIVTRCHAELGVHIWLDPERVTLSENINLPLVKSILDKTSDDLKKENAQVGKVLDLFISGMVNEDLWIDSCTYEDGRRTAVKLFDRSRMLAYLSNLLKFHEAKVAPFVESAQEFSVPEQHQYNAELGPTFQLRRDRQWQRYNIPGSRRIRLYGALKGLIDQRAPGTDDLSWQRKLVALLLLLPNRVDHSAESEQVLKQYADSKAKMIQFLEKRLAKASDDETRYEILRLIIRFCFSFHPEPRSVSEKTRKIEQQLASAETARGKQFARALVYERLFLKLANPRPGAGPPDNVQRLRYLFDLLLQEHHFHGEPNDFQRALILSRRAGEAKEYLSRVGKADIVAFYPLLEALSESKEHPEMLAPDVASRVLWAYAMVLPYYGLDPKVLVEFPEEEGYEQPEAPPGAEQTQSANDQWLDRLVFFSQLSAAAKGYLTTLATDTGGDPANRLSDAARAHAAQLLIDHNNIAMTLAGKVFNNRKWLKATLEDKHYTEETIDFAVLYHKETPIDLNAKDLLDGAVKGCELNFELARASTEAAQTDEIVLDFLFHGNRWFGSASVPRTPSLDSVLRTCSRLAKDPRYEGDSDKAVLDAAAAFQKAANKFIEKPPPLLWFRADDAAMLDRADSYLRTCELAGQCIVEGEWEPWKLPDRAGPAIQEKIDRWEREARAVHVQLWKNLLLGDQGAPVWTPAFVYCSCTPEEPNASGQAASQADLLHAQRQLLERLVRPESEDPPQSANESYVPLRGLQHTLTRLDQLEAQDSKSPGAVYYRRYWMAARALIHAAQLGEGLDPGTPFLAQPFMASPGGCARSLTEEEVLACLQATSERSPYDALDWPNRWDDQFRQERLRQLLGTPLDVAVAERSGRCGLGGNCGPPTKEKPVSYRHAAWLAMSGYAADRLWFWIDRLDSASGEQLQPANPADRLRLAWSQQDDVRRNVLRIIDFRDSHNVAMGILRDRSEQAVTVKDAGTRRARAWACLNVDKQTVRWAKELRTDDPWLFLVPIWTPFEEYYPGLKLRSEPKALDLTLAGWNASGGKRAEVRLQSMLYLLSLAELTSQGNVRLSPACQDAFQQSVGNTPAGDPKGCLDSIQTWTDLPSWLLLLKQDVQRDIAALPGYEYYAIPREAVVKHCNTLGPLADTLIQTCHWSTPPSRSWVKKYKEKTAFVQACAEAPGQIPLSDDAGSVSTLVALYDFVCRLEPCASPYAARLDRSGRRIQLATAPRTWWPTTIRAMSNKRQAAVREHIRPWCLLQRRVTDDGSLVTQKAGFMGYVDFLKQPRK